MLTTLAEATRYLQREDYLQAAQKNADFLLNELYVDGYLYRSWRDGRAQHNAYLEDYVSLALGLLSLYQSDGNLRWFKAARSLTEAVLTHFLDPDGGFFDTSDAHEDLLLRPQRDSGQCHSQRQ